MRETIGRYRGLAFVCAALAILAAPPHGFPWPKVALLLYLVVVSYLRLRAGIVLLPVLSCLTATYLYHRVPALRPFGILDSRQIFTAWAPALAGWIVYLGLATRAIYLERGMPGVPDAGAKLNITWCPAKQYCAGCEEDKQRSEGTWLRICPDCGFPLQVSGGEELDVLDVTFVSGGASETPDAGATMEGSS